MSALVRRLLGLLDHLRGGVRLARRLDDDRPVGVLEALFVVDELDVAGVQIPAVGGGERGVGLADEILERGLDRFGRVRIVLITRRRIHRSVPTSFIAARRLELLSRRFRQFGRVNLRDRRGRIRGSECRLLDFAGLGRPRDDLRGGRILQGPSMRRPFTQRIAQHRYGLEPIGRRLGQRLQDHLGQHRLDTGRRLRRLGQMTHHDLAVRRAVERQRAREQLVHHDAERVDVGALVGAAAELLGRHVERVADDDALVDAAGEAGRPEVEHLDREPPTDGREEDVARLEAAVDDPFGVRALERGGDAVDDLDGAARGERPRLLERGLEIDAGELVHEKVELAVVAVAAVVDADEVVVARRCERLELRPQALRMLLLRELAVHDLDGHLRAHEVLGAVDLAGRPFAEVARELVAAERLADERPELACRRDRGRQRRLRRVGDLLGHRSAPLHRDSATGRSIDLLVAVNKVES